MTRHDISLRVSANPGLLSSVRGLIRIYLKEAGFEDGRVDELVLGVDEVCTNAIRHACEGCEDEYYDITLRSQEEWLEIRVEDPGEPFIADEVKAQKAPVPEDVSQVQPGGLGLRLIFEVFDAVEFCSDAPKGNCVTMRLRRPTSATGNDVRE